MPPVRTFPQAKPIKSERTHEENQERAYIAASRRSDRSLEARVESARRASEIHKRRTGRSLRVTEQDVINEEMYEEEDDDLPSQYRRLTAHLQTGSADFNRRLAAYLTNHVAMRSALEQAINSSFAQQFPNAPQFAHNNPTAFPSPFSPQSLMQASPSAASPATPATAPKTPATPATPTSAHLHRQTPYPMPGTAGYRQKNVHHRTSSASMQERPTQALDFLNSPADEFTQHVRRMSFPSQNALSLSGQPTPVPTPSLKQETLKSDTPTTDDIKEESAAPVQQTLGSFALERGVDISPFSTALPTSSQMLLGSALDPMDPLTSSLMAGSESFKPIQFDPSFYGSMNKQTNFRPSPEGMNSTLAPPASADDADGKDEYTKSGDFKLGMDSFGFSNNGANLASDSDGGWDAFINDDSWTENAT